MFFRQFYDTPLAQASYMIGCQATGEAIVIDPSRDVTPYARAAELERLRIAFVTETHIHADFVSGSRELSALTGARILLSAEGGDNWQYQFAASDNAQLLHNGDTFMVGNIRFEVMHTPGHTPEHLSFVVSDTPAGAGAMGILTGDFVFVGDVGRPDLLEKAARMMGTMEAGARTLFASLEKFRALPDHLQVWPGHGAGSACGKALGAVPFSTVGYEKLANWGLNVPDEAAFVKEVLRGQPDPPSYFARMKRVNREGPRVLRGIVTPPKLPTASIHQLMQEGTLVVDIRAATQFAEAHIPGTVNIAYGKNFATWAGWLLDADVDVTLLTTSEEHQVTPDALMSAVRDLVTIGIDRVTGWLDQDALPAWAHAGHALGSIQQISVPEFAALRASNAGTDALVVLDVRNDDEWARGHIAEALHHPLGHLMESFDGALDTPLDTPIVVHCQSGVRSAIAASLLQRAGYTQLRNLSGGINAYTLPLVT